MGQKIIERVVEKIIQVEVPVDRIVERKVEVEKIVYVDSPVPVEHCSLIDLFSSLIASRMEVKTKLIRTQGRSLTSWPF